MYFVCDIQDISAQITYEDKLEKYERIVDTSIDQMSLVNKNYIYEAVNEAYVKNHALSKEEIVGHSVAEINTVEAFEETIKPHLDRALRGEIVQYQSEFSYRGRGKRYMEVSYFPYRNKNRDVTAVVVHVRDITDTKVMENKLMQAQKMEAIGTLAGGIAHDFNNILSAIMGHAELAQMNLEGEPEISANLSQIVVAAERAKELVKQILTFSRKSEIDLRLLDLNKQLLESINLLKRTIPKMIGIEIKLGQELEPVLADATQLNQVIMNLASNASDAMPEGGKLIFATSSMDLDQDYCQRHLDIKPGRYLILTVTDTGAGMDKKTQDKIFDPFFTTKEIGKGTGLGLSTVYGIVKEHGGQITCYSELGQGTSFRVYLPAHETAMRLKLPALKIQEAHGGTESILLVDDEPAIRKSSSLILEDSGYKIHTAANGEEALDFFKEHPAQVDLVILDLGMPGMGGRKCLDELLAIDPTLKILVASGYSADGRIQDTLDHGASAFIAKPFRRNDLLKAVRRLLDQ
jgi:PAS domain S-box-containing protein